MSVHTRQAATGIALALAAGALFLAFGRSSATAAHAHAARPPWPPLRTARVFWLDELHQKVEGRWGETWRSLYPLHRQVASRWAYVRCERATPFVDDLESVRVLSVRRAPVHVPGLSRLVPGVALRARITLGWYSPRDPIVFTHTFHLVPVQGRWTWLLSAERYRLYRTDGCGLHPAA